MYFAFAVLRRETDLHLVDERIRNASVEMVEVRVLPDALLLTGGAALPFPDVCDLLPEFFYAGGKADFLCRQVLPE